MIQDSYKAEQDAARKLFEAERTLKEQQTFYRADMNRRRQVWAVALERALLDIEELTDDARDRRADLFRAQDEVVKTRADATFRIGTMAMDLEAAKSKLEDALQERDHLFQERDRLLFANRLLATELATLRAETAGA
jgi:hypothetical protein